MEIPTFWWGEASLRQLFSFVIFTFTWSIYMYKSCRVEFDSSLSAKYSSSQLENEIDISSSIGQNDLTKQKKKNIS